MAHTMNRSERTFLCIYYSLSYLVFPSVFSLISRLLNIPLWHCQIALFAMNFFFSVLICRRYLLEDGKMAVHSIGKFLSGSILGFVFYYTANLGVSYLIYFLQPEYINLNDAQIVNLAQEGSVGIILCTVFLAPIAEELLFRGLLFGAVHRKHPAMAWIVSASAFSAAHVIGYIGQYNLFSCLLAFVQYLPAGFCLAFAYKRSGTIFAPVLIHTVNNLIGATILFQ